MALEEIRVLVVDDSAVIRSLIADSIAATPGMKVVGTAEDGQKALEILDAVRPDVITLDVQMPRMDGLATLDAILARRPIPVIMVSSLTKLGAEIALDALDRGAVDYLAKPDYGEKTRTALRDELPRKIRMAAGCDVQRILEIRREQRKRIAERAAQGRGQLQVGAEAGHRSDRWPRQVALGQADRRSRPSWPENALRSAFPRAVRPPWPSCSRRFGRPCRRSSWCSTCPRVSRNRWPGGWIRSASCRSKRPPRGMFWSPITS